MDVGALSLLITERGFDATMQKVAALDAAAAKVGARQTEVKVAAPATAGVQAALTRIQQTASSISGQPAVIRLTLPGLTAATTGLAALGTEKAKAGTPISIPVSPPNVGPSITSLRALTEASKSLDVTSARSIATFRQQVEALRAAMRQAGATAAQFRALDAAVTRVNDGIVRSASAVATGGRQLGPATPQFAAQVETMGLQAALASQKVTGLGVGVASLSRLFPILGAAATAAALTRFASSTITAADALKDMREQTGASVESLSVFQQVAAKSGVTADIMAVGLRTLARQTSALRAGNREAAASFAAIGLSAKDLEGLSIDQIFVKVADAQSHFADGTGKTALALKLFGRSGEELIPMLNELANGGFDEATRKARALGGVVGEDFVQEADRFNDAMADMKTATGGLGRSILSDALPPLTRMIEGMLAFRQRAREATEAAPGPVRAFIQASQQAAARGPLFATVFGSEDAEAQRARTFGEWITETGRRLLGLSSTAAVAAAGIAAATKFTPQGPPRPDIQIVDPEKEKALFGARLAAAVQFAQNQLTTTAALIDRQESLNAQGYALGIVNLRDYFDTRVEIAAERSRATIAALEAERRALSSGPTGETPDEAIQRETQRGAVAAQIEAERTRARTAEQAFMAERDAAERALAQRIAGFEQKRLEAQGQTHAVRMQQIADEADAYQRVLAVDPTRSPETKAALVTALRTALTLQEHYNEAQRESARIFEELGAERERIGREVERGALSEIQGQQAIAAEEKKRLPDLQKIAAAMLRFATELKNPELIAAAKRLGAALGAMAAGPLTAAEKFQRDFKAILDRLKDQATGTARAVSQALQRELAKNGGVVDFKFNVRADALAGLAAQIDEQFAMFGINAGTTFSSALTAGFSAAFTANSDKNFFEAAGNVILQGLGSTLVTMGETLLTAGLALVGLLPALSNIFTSGPAMIIAGGLIAGAGAALGAIATNNSGSRTGGGGASARAPAARDTTIPTQRVTLDPDRRLREAREVAPKVAVREGARAAPTPAPFIFAPTIIGTKDPAAVRDIGEMVNAAWRRNILKLTPA